MTEGFDEMRNAASCSSACCSTVVARSLLASLAYLMATLIPTDDHAIMTRSIAAAPLDAVPSRMKLSPTRPEIPKRIPQRDANPPKLPLCPLCLASSSSSRLLDDMLLLDACPPIQASL